MHNAPWLCKYEYQLPQNVATPVATMCIAIPGNQVCTMAKDARQAFLFTGVHYLDHSHHWSISSALNEKSAGSRE